jgi:hypothetical protein
MIHKINMKKGKKKWIGVKRGCWEVEGQGLYKIEWSDVS